MAASRVLPSFETLAEFIIGPRFARTRWQAPQDEAGVFPARERRQRALTNPSYELTPSGINDVEPLHDAKALAMVRPLGVLLITGNDEQDDCCDDPKEHGGGNAPSLAPN